MAGASDVVLLRVTMTAAEMDMARLSGWDLKFALRGATAAERARARMHHLGFTPRGHPLWTEAEEAALKEAYPDYGAALRKLKRRTYHACRARARHLDLVKRRQCWTAAEEMRLRRMFGRAARSELLAAFPSRSWSQIAVKARSLRLRRPKAPTAPTPWQPIDAIKARARELNYTLPDVDQLAGSKTYFARAGWTGRRQIHYQHVGRAVEALGGRLVVVWDDPT